MKSYRTGLNGMIESRAALGFLPCVLRLTVGREQMKALRRL